MEDKLRILVVDDEPQILRVLRQILSSHSYLVRTAEDGRSALRTLSEWKPDLVLTDLQMPNMHGLDFCRELRKRTEMPLVVLSVRDEEKTIVEALDAGADDYVVKPFGTNELLARLRSVMRRASSDISEHIEIGNFKLDVTAHSASLREQVLRLTPKEFDLLTCFLRHPERVLTHSFLLKEVWGSYYEEQPEALRVLIASLRRKIEPEPSNPTYIQTEPWVGYRFLPDG